MINYSINEENIKSDSSILLFAFAGWPDAGQAATNALKTLSENLNANKIAEIESEDFYNLCSEAAQKRFNSNYTEKAWKANWEKTNT